MARLNKRKLGAARNQQKTIPGQPGIHPETIASRLRRLDRAGIRARSARDALDPLAGSTLGLLLMRHRASPHDPGSVDEQQYEAGQAWAKLAVRYAVLMGYTIGSETSWLVAALRGLSCKQEPAAAEVERVRKLWSDCNQALADVRKLYGFPVRAITYAVCIENRRIEALSPDDYGNLRIGLNALGKVLGISERGATARLLARRCG
jgi:hypothetical protein